MSCAKKNYFFMSLAKIDFFVMICAKKNYFQKISKMCLIAEIFLLAQHHLNHLATLEWMWYPIF